MHFPHQYCDAIRMDGYDAIVELEQIFTDHEKLGSSIIQTFMPNFAKAKAGYPIASMDTDEDVAETIEAQVCQGATVDAQGLKAGEAQPSASVRGIVESGMQTEFRRRVLIEYGKATFHSNFWDHVLLISSSLDRSDS
eukprot:SAG31_NODE_116_length_24094_cov_38.884184_17_plen_138_part_00